MSVELIAEIGSNWQGDLTILDALARAAKRAGADTLKVQHYPANLGPHPFTQAQLGQAQDIALAHDLNFLASVFDDRTLDEYREACLPERVKIASPELTHDPLLSQLGDLEVLISTGASTVQQINHATAVLHRAGVLDITFLHCVSAYPAPPEHMNLTAMRPYGHRAGLSDHTEHPTAAPVAAVALGATVIEKHFTLDRSLDGPDHHYAVDEDGLRQMCEAVRLCELMLGDGQKRVMPSEDPTDRR